MTEPLHSLTHVIETAVSSLRHRPQNFPSVIEWACPVPFFGRAEKARVASVGLNPSGQEFYDRKRHPLRGNDQRLATLESHGLRDWSAAGPAECSAVAQACSGRDALGCTARRAEHVGAGQRRRLRGERAG